jgi:hypothetical protein
MHNLLARIGMPPIESLVYWGHQTNRMGRKERMQSSSGRWLLLLSLLPAPVLGQETVRPRLRVGERTGALRIDGHVQEADWLAADSIANLTQVEPSEGGTPAGRTVVRVLADRGALYISVIAYDSDAKGIVTQARDRDAGLANEDHIRFVLDTFLNGRTGYIFALNPSGARFDALVANQGEGENSNWDAIWESATQRRSDGWSAEVRIPIRSLGFKQGLDAWGFNIQRRVQRLQEVSRWAGARLDYRVMQTSRAGLLTDLPPFQLGVGLSVRPAVAGGVGVPAPNARVENDTDVSLDATQRLSGNLLGALTVNTDFAETDADTRRTNLTRFPLFFPEKRSFFLEGADIFEFGLGLGQDLVPFHSRRIGLLEGQEVPLRAGGKVNGRVGATSLGMLVSRTGNVQSLAPAATLGALRVKQDLFRESSAGVIATMGDPMTGHGSWTAGADFTYQTSRFRGNKNFLVGVWGLATDGDSVSRRHALGFKIDYPNDDWDIVLTYRRIEDGFQPALGFVPRTAVQLINGGANYRYRPSSGLFRTWFFELQPSLAADLNDKWESYRVFFAPINVRLESGDRFEFNANPTGERLVAPFEIADNVVIPPGEYHWLRYRLEAQLAAKRRFSGQFTWWFGGFYQGTLHELDFTATWRPLALLTADLTLERNIGSLPEGDFTQEVVGVRTRLNISPDLNFSTFVQYDREAQQVGSNTRIRWTFHPLGDLFLVYNHNLRELTDRWSRDSNQFIAKVQYTLRY